MADIQFLKQRFVDLFHGTLRDDIDLLVGNLDRMGFFNAPCSTCHHLAEYGGLLEHSLNVCEIAQEVASSIGYTNIDSVIVASLLHDVGKCGDYGKQNYVENYLKTRDKEGNPKRSETKPFVTNKDLLYLPHEVRSIAIVRQWFSLTEEEEHAIYYHNGKYTHTGYDLKETALQMIIHFADLWCSREVEKGEEDATEEYFK